MHWLLSAILPMLFFMCTQKRACFLAPLACTKHWLHSISWTGFFHPILSPIPSPYHPSTCVLGRRSDPWQCTLSSQWAEGTSAAVCSSVWKACCSPSTIDYGHCTALSIVPRCFLRTIHLLIAVGTAVYICCACSRWRAPRMGVWHEHVGPQPARVYFKESITRILGA